jgi:hypothetical protein
LFLHHFLFIRAGHCDGEQLMTTAICHFAIGGQYNQAIDDICSERSGQLHGLTAEHWSQLDCSVIVVSLPHLHSNSAVAAKGEVWLRQVRQLASRRCGG